MQTLVDAGFSLRIDGENLIVSPVSKLTPEHADYIRQHKVEIVAELRAADEAGREQFPADQFEIVTLELLTAAGWVRFKVAIPKERWNPFEFLAFLEGIDATARTVH